MISRIALVTMFVGVLAPAGFTQTAPSFELPAPTGKLPIGTTRWVVTDPARQETFAPGQPRQVEVLAWYPAVASAEATAPYLRDGMEEVLSFARLAKLGNAFDGLAVVKTHAVLDAMLAASPARFPVIVFSHGYTGLPSSHTSLFEDLASHGWAVLSVVHPYEATASMLADGTVITFLNEQGTMRQGIMDVLNEWGPEGGTMDKVTAAADDGEKEKLLRGYLDFTDMNFWGGPLRQRGAYGAIAPARAAEVTRTIVREFFAQEMLGQKSALLAGEQKWDGVTVAQQLRKP